MDEKIPRLGQPEPTPESRIPAMRFSLRTLLALVLIAGTALGWVGMRRQHARRNAMATRELAKLGGSVGFGEGEREIVQVSFSGPRFKAEAITRLTAFPRLARLVLIDTSLDDEACAQIAKLTNLQELLVMNASIGDDSAAHLGKLTNLTSLWLNNTEISDAGFAHLTSLQKLRRLDLIGSKITDAGLVHLAELPNLEKLYIQQTGVTREGVNLLKQVNPELKIEW